MIEVAVCPVEGCGGRMHVVDIALEPDGVARVLDSPERDRRPLPEPPRRSSGSRSPELRE